jgi:hypothetical protein
VDYGKMLHTSSGVTVPGLVSYMSGIRNHPHPQMGGLPPHLRMWIVWLSDMVRDAWSGGIRPGEP